MITASSRAKRGASHTVMDHPKWPCVCPNLRRRGPFAVFAARDDGSAGASASLAHLCIGRRERLPYNFFHVITEHFNSASGDGGSYSHRPSLQSVILQCLQFFEGADRKSVV